MSIKKYLVGMALVGLTACNNSEIDELRSLIQDQQTELDELNGKIGDLEDQQAALLSEAVQNLNKQIADLGSDNTDLAQELADLVQELEENKETVFWGTVGSDGTYNDLVTHSASIIMGNVIIRDAADLAKLQEVEVISGNLTVTETSLSAISLPMLKSIGGDLLVEHNNQLTSFSADMLVGVAGDFNMLFNNNLNAVDLSNFTVLEGNFTIENEEYDPNGGEIHSVIEGKFDFSSLLAIGGEFRVYYVRNLKTLDVSALKLIEGDLSVYENSKLEDLMFDVLDEVRGSVHVFASQSSAIREFDTFNEVTKVEGDITIDLAEAESMHIFSNLETIDYVPTDGSNHSSSELSTKKIILKGNRNLILLEGFDKVRNVGTIEITPRKFSSSGSLISAFPALKYANVFMDSPNQSQTDPSSEFQINHEVTVENFVAFEKGTLALDGINMVYQFQDDAFSNLEVMHNGNPNFISMEGYDGYEIKDVNPAFWIRRRQHTTDLPEMNLCPFQRYLKRIPSNEQYDWFFEYVESDYSVEEGTEWATISDVELEKNMPSQCGN